MKKIILSALLAVAIQASLAGEVVLSKQELLDQLKEKQALLADLDRRIIELDDANVAMLNKINRFMQNLKDGFKAKMIAENPKKEVNVEELKYRYISEMVRISNTSIEENQNIIVDESERRQACLFKFYYKKYETDKLQLDEMIFAWEKLFNEICDIKNKLILIEA